MRGHPRYTEFQDINIFAQKITPSLIGKSGLSRDQAEQENVPADAPTKAEQPQGSNSQQRAEPLPGPADVLTNQGEQYNITQPLTIPRVPPRYNEFHGITSIVRELTPNTAGLSQLD